MGIPHPRRATEDDSAKLAVLIPGLVPSATDDHHATFVIDGPDGPVAVLDLQQGSSHLNLLHLQAPDLAHARVLQEFAETAARAFAVREIRLRPGALSPDAAGALGYRNGIRHVSPDGVPLWRDGTAPFAPSLYRRGMWAALALLLGLASVSIAVFNSGEVTLAHILIPAVLCIASSLFALWQMMLVVQASRRSSRQSVFLLSAAVACVAAGLIGLTLYDRALPALAELWEIRTGDNALGDLDVTVSEDGRTLTVAGAYGTHSEEAVREALDLNRGIREVVLEGPGGRASVGFALFDMFRRRKLATRVDGDCASACTIAFLGGVQRTISPSGRLGFHRASFPGMDDEDMYESNRDMRNFMIHRVGLAPEFVHRVIDTPARSIWVPTREELLAGKVITR